MSPSKVGFDHLSLKMYQDLRERMGIAKFVKLNIVGKMRMIKDAEEMERIRRASDFADIGMVE